MSLVFVDCGAFTGDSIEIFRTHHPEGDQAKIYAFECNPKLYRKLEKDPSIEVIKRAVWISDKSLKFYLGGEGYDESSTVISSKRTGHLDKIRPIKVNGIDFASWLKNHVTKEDRVIVKMNIEGAEYEVLNHLCDTGSIDLIDLLLVQWHVNKIKMSKEDHNILVKKLDKRGVSCAPWDINRMDDMIAILHGKSSEIQNP